MKRQRGAAGGPEKRPRDVSSGPSLLDLPDELLVAILVLLPPHDWARSTYACRRLAAAGAIAADRNRFHFVVPGERDGLLLLAPWVRYVTFKGMVVLEDPACPGASYDDEDTLITPHTLTQLSRLRGLEMEACGRAAPAVVRALREVRQLRLRGCELFYPLLDTDISHLAHLEDLELETEAITDSGLGQLTALRRLRLSAGSAITLAGLAPLGLLQHLVLEGRCVTGGGRLPNQALLSLRDQRVQGAVPFDFSALTSLRRLTLLLPHDGQSWPVSLTHLECELTGETNLHTRLTQFTRLASLRLFVNNAHVQAIQDLHVLPLHRLLLHGCVVPALPASLKNVELRACSVFTNMLGTKLWSVLSPLTTLASLVVWNSTAADLLLHSAPPSLQRLTLDRTGMVFTTTFLRFTALRSLRLATVPLCGDPSALKLLPLEHLDVTASTLTWRY